MERIVISHFDGHGVATGAAIARRINAGLVSKFPDTGPIGFPDFIDRHLNELRGNDVVIVDIPINVRDPDGFIDALGRLASAARSVEYHDHHSSNKGFAHKMPSNIKYNFYNDAAAMATGVARTYGIPEDSIEYKLLIVGIVADRDQSVLTLVDRKTIEEEYLPLANALDVLVRRDLDGTLQGLMGTGLQYLEDSLTAVDYPPSRLVQQINPAILAKTVVLTQIIDARQDRELAMWLPKTLEQFALKTGRDIVVAPVVQIHPKTREEIYSVRVLKYWLSTLPDPGDVVREFAEARGMPTPIGHGGYISLETGRDEDTLFQTAMYVARALEDHYKSNVPEAGIGSRFRNV